MLVTPEFNFESASGLMHVLSLIGQDGQPTEIETGIFLTNNFSMDSFIVNAIEEYFDFYDGDEYLNAFGVCDTVEQVKKRYAKWLNDPTLKFCISLTKIKKSDQPTQGGWRWHKWGPYIGEKSPECEYIYDEGEDIEEVYVYHIYKILD